MPIKFQWKKLPVDADGKSYDSLEAFQEAEVAKVILSEKDKLVTTEEDALGFGKLFVKRKAEIIEILELTCDARPSARGVSKKRKAKTEPAQAESPKAA